MIEKGKWYRSDNVLIYATSNQNEKGYFSGYGLCADNTWIIETCKAWISNCFTPAQDDYVIQRMQSEVNKRYSIGDVVRCLSDGEEVCLAKTYYEDYKCFLLKDGELWGCDETESLVVLLMKDGKWAEKVEKENPNETKEHTSLDNNKKIIDELINGKKGIAKIDKNGNLNTVKTGDKVIMVKSSDGDIDLTIGNVYEVTDVDGQGVIIIDDVGEENTLLDYQYKLVDESKEVTTEPKETEIPKRFTEQEFLQQFEDEGFKMYKAESITKKLHRLEFLENLLENNEVTFKPLNEKVVVGGNNEIVVSECLINKK